MGYAVGKVQGECDRQGEIAPNARHHIRSLHRARADNENIYDRWGNKLYSAPSCVLNDGYVVPNTGVK